MRALVCFFRGHRWEIVSFATPVQLRCRRCQAEMVIPMWRDAK